ATPVLIDPANLIYQINDGSATIGAVYDGGYATYTGGTQVANLYSGSTPAGQYRVDKAHGLFQVGTAATFGVTVDFIADGPATETVIAQLLPFLLLSIMKLPVSTVGSADGLNIDWLGPDPAVSLRAMGL